jgi:hypothetical protein
MKLFKKLWEKIVINQYISAGLQWGDATSYLDIMSAGLQWEHATSYLSIMGEAVGYDKMEKRLYFWERKYQELGYTCVDLDIWVSAGGYGRDLNLI